MMKMAVKIGQLQCSDSELALLLSISSSSKYSSLSQISLSLIVTKPSIFLHLRTLLHVKEIGHRNGFFSEFSQQEPIHTPQVLAPLTTPL
jgi:hypothetical protein